MSRKSISFIALLFFTSFEGLFSQEISWAWMAGEKESFSYYAPRFGIKGEASPLNYPGNRQSAATFATENGLTYVFGGSGHDYKASLGYLNDLWVWDGLNWTWLGGSKDLKSPPHFGEIGITSEANLPPGRYEAMIWADEIGNVWLFGGQGRDETSSNGFFNDLWKWDGSNWTWLSGSNYLDQSGLYSGEDSHYPGARVNSIVWIDSDGTLWLFGGFGRDANGDEGYLNDLWKWDGNDWAWIGGSDEIGQVGVYGEVDVTNAENYPGARAYTSGRMDSDGNVWVFGGLGYGEADFGQLNDLWMWDGSNWVWKSGSKAGDTPSTYGTIFEPSISNSPGGRYGSALGIDVDGGILIFGGTGRDEVGSSGYLRDIWRWDENGWAWQGGEKLRNLPGNYIQKGEPTATGAPGARALASMWFDETGRLFVYGGNGYSDTSETHWLNDFWSWEDSEWTWRGGFPTLVKSGNFGIKGAATPGASPSGRSASSGWMDPIGAIWIFGGYGTDKNGGQGPLNDMWRWDGVNWIWMYGSDTKGNPGQYGTMSVRAEGNYPSARSSSATWVDESNTLWLFGGESGSFSLKNDLWKWDGDQWTWVKGSNLQNDAGSYGSIGEKLESNNPGARSNATVALKNSEEVYLFGGRGFIQGVGFTYFNDLWRWDGHDWVLINGSAEVNQTGNYGLKGVGDAGNIPPARYGAFSWVDEEGAFWMFGGSSLVGSEERVYNDLWKWDGESWTWVAGSSVPNQPGNYGILGAPAASNVPGARTLMAGWKDRVGNVWIYGGSGFGSEEANAELNDLWLWDGEGWVWMDGSNTVDQGGVFGSIGEASSDFVPGARRFATPITAPCGDIWLFGGIGMDSKTQHGRLNDLWRVANGAVCQQITFGELPVKKFGDKPFELSATGGGSGNPVLFASSNEEVATIDGNTVTIVGPGEAIITATQEGDDTFAAAEPVERTLLVKKTEPEFQFAFNAADLQLSGGEVKAWDVDVDTDGNIYVVGYFSESADFDPGPGTFFLTSLSNRDIFIAKYTEEGSLLFAKSISGLNSLYGNNIAVTNDGEFWISGKITGTADVDPGEGVYNLTANNQLFVAKFSDSAELLFAYAFDGDGSSTDVDLKVDGLGNAILTGNFTSNMGVNHKSGRKTLFSSGNSDIFLVKYSPLGELLYGVKFGASGYDSPSSMAVDDFDNVLIAGSFTGTIDFDPGIETLNLTSAGDQDIFFSKFNSTGELIFSKRIGGSSTDFCSSITIDGQSNLWITGTFRGSVDFNPNDGIKTLSSSGWADIFIAKFNLSGEFLAAEKIGGGEVESVDRINADSQGNIYISGEFPADLNFGSVALEWDGEAADIYFAKYDSDLNFIFAKKLNGEFIIDSNASAVDQDGNLIVAGYFAVTIDMDPENGVFNLEIDKSSFNSFIGKYSLDGGFKWAAQLGNIPAISTMDSGNDIEIDEEGNVYVTGYFGGLTDFDPGEGVAELVNEFGSSLFLAKYDKFGNLIFAKGNGSNNSFSFGEDLALDGEGNIWVTGTFIGDTDFDLGAGVNIVSGNSQNDIFLAKYDNAGELIFVKTIAGTNYEYVEGLVIGSDGSALITGRFQGTVDFDPGPGERLLTSAGSYDIFLAKYSTTGDIVFALSMGGSNSQGATSVNVDSNGDIIMTGYYLGTSDFDPGVGTFQLVPIGPTNSFIAKYNADGSLIFAKPLGGNRYTNTSSVLIDSKDNILLVGDYSGTTDFDLGDGVSYISVSGVNDVFLAKYNTNGNLIFAEKIGGAYGVGLTYCSSAKTDSDDNILITGRFNSLPDFDPKEGKFELSSNGGLDIFLSKYNPSGSLIYARSIGGVLDDVGNDIAVGANGEVWVTGQFSHTVDFDPTLKQSELATINNTGDIFLAKFEEKAAQAIIFDAPEAKTYGDEPFELSAEGDEEGDLIVFASSDSKVAAVVENTATIKGAGEVFLIAVRESDGVDAYTEERRKLVVEKAPLEIIAQDLELEYGVSPSESFSVEFDGFVYEEDETDLKGTLRFVELYRPGVGLYQNQITPYGFTSSNYQIHTQSADLTVIPTYLLIIGNDLTVEYGDDPNELLTVSYDGFAYDDDENGDANGNQTLWGEIQFEAINETERGTYLGVVVPSGVVSNSNYDLTFQTGDLTIKKRKLTVTGDDISIPYDSPIPPLNYTIVNFAFDENEEVLTSEVVINATAVQGDVPGEYPIEVSGGAADNYSFKYVAGTLTIEKLDQDLTFGQIADKVFGDTAFELSAESTVEGEITFSSSDESVVSVEGNMATIVGAGEVTITAHKAGSDWYSEAEVVQSVTVSKASQTITFVAPEAAVYGDGDVGLVASSTSGLEVIFQSSDESVVLVEGAKVKIIGAGTATLTASQAGDENYEAANTVEHLFNVARSPQEIAFAELAGKTFGDEPFELSASTNSGLDIVYTSSDETVATIEGSLVSIVGAGETVVTARQIGNANYEAAEVEQTLTIARASQSITFEEIADQLLSTGSIALEVEASSGLIVALEVIGSATLEGSTLTFTGSGEVTVSASQEGNANYLPSEPISRSFEVTDDTVIEPVKEDQAITFEAVDNKTFGDTPFELSATASSGLPVTLSVNEGPATVSGSVVTITGAGTVTIVANQDGNEAFNPASPTSQTFTVAKATAEITLSGLAQEADGSPKEVQVSTSPEGLSVEVAYNGSLDAPSEAGSYLVTATIEEQDYQGSAEGILSLTVIETGVELDGWQISVFPNPVSEKLTVEVKAHMDGNIYLFDMLGRKRLEKALDSIVTILNLRHQPAGIYLLVVENDKGEIVKRVKVRKE
ncbi:MULTISPECIES: MBG domain-containing protein [unclassified Imperialibacter]|uniref:Kelch repeat-containing protein n=1 Tax=unclassified Imperialibacter TaxID=2629706 RepID=UPI0012527539|nr:MULTISPECIES: MBG domain-containing protein [unclassified Imperialibacter]CAD5252326.1 hypothetical protein IMPERIA75_180074 [Imperialibacter sp. 75]CAD5298368.1 hypothetical protein IMPERIA89_730072 [Imperialibacter sp. 89]VVT13728.1 hypothetical protein IMPR6_200071 [Imperialibacter sp. EC-SDR9]